MLGEVGLDSLFQEHAPCKPGTAPHACTYIAQAGTLHAPAFEPFGSQSCLDSADTHFVRLPCPEEVVSNCRASAGWGLMDAYCSFSASCGSVGIAS